MGEQGFPKRERLRRRREFRAVQSRGGRFHAGVMLVMWAPGPTPWTRLGVTASRRVGGAVQRNRAKRLIREAFRRTKAILPPATDLVIIASAKTAEASCDEVIQGLTQWAERHAEPPREAREEVNG